MEIAWWHWIVGGLLIALLELAVPAFFLIWFGLGALLVGILMLVVPMNLTAQFLVWAGASIMMVFLWFRIGQKPGPHQVWPRQGRLSG